MADRLEAPGNSSAANTPTSDELISELHRLYRSGRLRECLELGDSRLAESLSSLDRARVLLAQGITLYDLGNAVDAIERLRAADECSRPDPRTNFEIAFALFLRLSDFSEPKVLVASLGRLRQLACYLADVRSLGSLHLAVARLEGIRGGCL